MDEDMDHLLRSMNQRILRLQGSLHGYEVERVQKVCASVDQMLQKYSLDNPFETAMMQLFSLPLEDMDREERLQTTLVLKQELETINDFVHSLQGLSVYRASDEVCSGETAAVSAYASSCSYYDKLLAVLSEKHKHIQCASVSLTGNLIIYKRLIHNQQLLSVSDRLRQLQQNLTISKQ
ncbi:hypothetical protein SJAG_03445 [Schizosaccharomyces japonicus yFS275]|uniref:Uncharacterized protein n=1 Tax=Schizosaccharomyces japonicus (strain yFS275 / FY16936) TaxID=402676 RepID=B6K492_SCHJY|nr:hypothetical protein SJAG_03445 [Schizosaccharomyces japonicus yFS275]EEB08299.1 hypothetical protein SJAG_03445 [Schizosaccharomyces japonicus yFS275]